MKKNKNSLFSQALTHFSSLMKNLPNAINFVQKQRKSIGLSLILPCFWMKGVILCSVPVKQFCCILDQRAEKNIKAASQNTMKKIQSINNDIECFQEIMSKVRDSIEMLKKDESVSNLNSSNDDSLNNNFEFITFQSPRIPDWIKNIFLKNSDILIINHAGHYYLIGTLENHYFKLDPGDNNIALVTSNQDEILVGYDKNFRFFQRIASRKL